MEVYSSANKLPGDDIDLPLDLIEKIAESIPETSIKLGHVVKNIDWSDEDNIRVWEGQPIGPLGIKTKTTVVNLALLSK